MDMISLQIQILIFLVIGYVCGKKGWISQSTAGQLNSLVMNLILPASIFKSFETELNQQILQSCSQILLLSVLFSALFVLISRFLWRFVQDSDVRINLEYGTMSNNSGTLGMIIAQAAFGMQGVLFASIYVLPVRILMWSYGVALYSRSGSVSWKETLKKVATHPCLAAIYLGLIYMFAFSSGFALPPVLRQLISSLAGCNTVLIMIVIGVILSDLPVQSLFQKEALWYCLARLFIIPALVLGILKGFGMAGIAVQVCVLELAMPAPVTMSMLAQKYHCGEIFASKMIFLSTLLSMATLPAWSFFLQAFGSTVL